MTGAKIPFYGRNMKLRVREEDINRVTVSSRYGFLVTKPRKAPESDARSALEKLAQLQAQ